MGMLNMEMVQNRLPALPASEPDTFWSDMGGDMRKALADRDAGVDPSVTRV
jgi:hypothetical protein